MLVTHMFTSVNHRCIIATATQSSEPKNVHHRTQRLITLMKEHDVTPKEVGELLGRTPQTVRVWRSAYELRTIPEHTLDALELKLSSARPQVAA